MKKQIAVLVLFITIAMTSFAQQATTGVELYRVHSAQVSLKVDEQWVDTTNNNIDYIISFDLDKAILKVDNKKATEIYLSSLTETSKGKDKDGDSYTKIVWMCRDENGNVCELTSVDYSNLPDRIFQLRYSDCVCIWYTVIIKRGNVITQPKTSNDDNGQRI